MTNSRYTISIRFLCLLLALLVLCACAFAFFVPQRASAAVGSADVPISTGSFGDVVDFSFLSGFSVTSNSSAECNIYTASPSGNMMVALNKPSEPLSCTLSIFGSPWIYEAVEYVDPGKSYTHVTDNVTMGFSGFRNYSYRGWRPFSTSVTFSMKFNDYFYSKYNLISGDLSSVTIDNLSVSVIPGGSSYRSSSGATLYDFRMNWTIDFDLLDSSSEKFARCVFSFSLLLPFGSSSSDSVSIVAPLMPAVAELSFSNLYPQYGYGMVWHVVSTSSAAAYSSGYKAGVSDTTVALNATINPTSASYNAGYQKGVDDSGNYSFASLIGAVVDAPVNAFKSMFNFELLGVNLTGFFMALFVLCVIVSILRVVL